jgi:hypothetical protein
VWALVITIQRDCIRGCPPLTALRGHWRLHEGDVRVGVVKASVGPDNHREASLWDQKHSKR